MDNLHSGISTYIIELLRAMQKEDTTNSYDIIAPAYAKKALSFLHNRFHLETTTNFLDHPIASILWHHTALPLRNYDLVHIPSIRRVPFIKKTKLIATVHDLALFQLPKKYDPFRRFYHHQFLRRAILQCDHIITPSYSTKEDLLTFTNYPEEKISVIYPGIDTDLYRPMDKEKAKELLKQTYQINAPFLTYVSRIEHPGKNHLALIQAFEEFKAKNNSPHHLILAGADWTGASIVKEYAKKSPISDQIHFLGYIPTKHTIALYSACDLMVFPSLYEGFGFPLLEAFACGAPTICSNVASLKELAENRAQTFHPQSLNEIRAAIEKALTATNNPKECIHFARSFSWQQTAHQLGQVYSIFN